MGQGGGSGGGGDVMDDGNDDDDADEDDEPVFGFKISLQEVPGRGLDAAVPPSQGQASISHAGVEIIVRWVLGVESVLFESFCGMLRRCIVSAGKEKG